MNREQFFAALDGIRIWRRGGQRAPHKPLLLLLALARVSRGRARLALYAEYHRDLERLLADFGPPRRTHHPNMPFWRLQGDGLWDIPEAAGLRRGRGRGGDVSPRALVDAGARGGFPEAAHEVLAADRNLVEAAVTRLLEGHFPQSLHDDIRDAIGLEYCSQAAEEPPEYRVARVGRDPGFRRAVITAYERRCAFCDFDIRLDDRLLGIEAAHIRWHACEGPDIVPNGLALCVFHHRAFDRGAIGLESGGAGPRRYRLIVSRELSGVSDAFRQLVDIGGHPLRSPQETAESPDPAFVTWHRREVFRGPPRGG